MAKGKTTRKITNVEKPIVEKKGEILEKDVEKIVEEIKEKIEEQESSLDLTGLVDEKETTTEDKEDIEVKEEPGFDIDLLRKFIKETNGLYLGGPAQRILDKIKKSL